MDGYEFEAGERITSRCEGLGINDTNLPIDDFEIDAFLGETLRALRNKRPAPWIASGDQDWASRNALNAIWSRIELHGLTVLINSGCPLLVGWPDKMIAAIAEENRIIGLWESTHRDAIAKVVKNLAEAGIESVLMKGTALAYSLHHEPSSRRRGDSDLLIRPQDHAEAQAILAKGGWQLNDDPHGLIYQETWRLETAGHFIHALDLHWEPSDRPVLQHVLRTPDFFDHKQPLPRLCPSAYRADYALTLIHEALNQKWHVTNGYWTERERIMGARRLIWSVDFDLLVGALEPADWARLETLCAERGVGPLVAEALRTASQDLETELPSEAISALEGMASHPDVTAYFATKDSLSEFWLDLRTARSWGQRLAMIKDRGFPPRAHLQSKYPAQSHWPTFLLQARLQAHTAVRIAKRVFTS